MGKEVRKNVNRRAGFVLVELLATVAILIVTFAIAAPNSSDLKFTFEQSTVDSYAKTIFESAQNRINHMFLSGQSSLLKNGRNKVSTLPKDYDGKKLYYVTSSEAASDMFFDGDIDCDWVIEYNADTGKVFGVFVSNGVAKGVVSASKPLELYETYKNSFDEFRCASAAGYKTFAKEEKYNISYYGNVTKVASYIDDKPTGEQTTDAGFAVSFCYYEVYSDGSVGYYAFPEYDYLKSGKIVIGDGYGVIIKAHDQSLISTVGVYQSENKGAYEQLNITWTDKSSKNKNPLSVNDDGEDYLIYRFPESEMSAVALSDSDLDYVNNELIQDFISTSKADLNDKLLLFYKREYNRLDQITDPNLKAIMNRVTTAINDFVLTRTKNNYINYLKTGQDFTGRGAAETELLARIFLSNTIQENIDAMQAKTDAIYNKINKKYNTRFYSDLKIKVSGKTVETWSYSPYFAKSAVYITDSNDLPDSVSIRSARQLNALSWLYSTYFTKAWDWDWNETRLEDVVFNQECNIDYAAYDWYSYTGRYFKGQFPIGTDWGRFVSDYNGHDYTIYNCKFSPLGTANLYYTYSGLFGFVANSTIQNVHIDGTTNNTVQDMDYCGIFAVYVESAWIYRCSVNNYTIKVSQRTRDSNRVVSHWDNENDLECIGCFIAYVNNPEEASRTVIIDNCSATNCKIYAETDFNAGANVQKRYYHIGGFVGGVANIHMGMFKANSITLSNCSFTGIVDITGNGNTKYASIGGFGGCIRTPVNIANVYNLTDGIKDNQHYTYIRDTLSL